MRNKKYRGGGVLFALILTLSMILSQVSVFADTASVPMLLTVETKPLDFTVTERIDMSAYQGETALNMNSVTVTNTGTEDLKVSSIAINPASGWTVEASSTDFTTASKTALGFICNNHDFSSGAYAPGDALTAGGNLTYTLSGQISGKADLTSVTQVASMVVTVEKAVNLISFTVRDSNTGTTIFDYQAEEGMTWEAFVNSSYSNGDFSVDGNDIRYEQSSKSPIPYGPVLPSDVIRDGVKYIYSTRVLDPEKSLTEIV